MKKRRLGALVVTLILTSSMIFGCGSSNKSASAPMEFATEEAYDSSFEAKSVYQSEGAMGDVENSMAEGMDSQVVDTSRKLITTMNISTETEDLDSVLFEVQNKVKELGGYVESSDIYNGSSYAGSKPRRNAYLTLRIPANNLDKFVEIVEGSTNITNKSTSVEDVTLNYVDIESKKNALKSEEKRLLEVLEKAETVEDIITIEQRLSEVRYQIESIESQLRTYDNKINYSTVYLDINEVTKYTDTAKKGPWQRMKEGFVESIAEVGDFFVEACVWFVVHIPQIILAILLLVVIVLIVRAIDKAGKKKRLKRMAMMQQMPPQNMTGTQGQVPPHNMQGSGAQGQALQGQNTQKDNNG